MGGNVSVLSASGEDIVAQKVDLKKVGRSNFMKTSYELFHTLNKLFKQKFNVPLWPNSSEMDSAAVFNGSTSFVLSNQYTDEDIIKVKSTVGDIDIAIPEPLGPQLFDLLYPLRDKSITPSVKFIGMNRFSREKIGNQINSLFEFSDGAGLQYLVQVDFELLPFTEEGSPTEWSKFSHSSTFADASRGIKAVHHKYLIRAMMHALSVREDILVATNKSTPDNIKLSRKVGLPRMLKFSVDRGARTAYELMRDANGTPITINGKEIYRELSTNESDYITALSEIYKLSFGDLPPNATEIGKFWSFTGILELIKKHIKRNDIEKIFEAYIKLLWGTNPDRGQELERNNPKLDFEVKVAGYNEFKKVLGTKDSADFEKQLEQYYSTYR